MLEYTPWNQQQKHLKMDGWKLEDDPFRLGRPIWWGELLVLGSVYLFLQITSRPIKPPVCEVKRGPRGGEK